jgi:hypothetical protein
MKHGAKIILNVELRKLSDFIVLGGSEERKCRLCKVSITSLLGRIVFLDLRDRDDIPLLLEGKN